MFGPTTCGRFQRGLQEPRAFALSLLSNSQVPALSCLRRVAELLRRASLQARHKFSYGATKKEPQAVRHCLRLSRLIQTDLSTGLVQERMSLSARDGVDRNCWPNEGSVLALAEQRAAKLSCHWKTAPPRRPQS
jgi:hypothetical protein